MSNGENLIKENYENDKTIKNEKENTKKNINKNDMSKSQLKIMELKDLINNTNNYVNDVDLKVKKKTQELMTITAMKVLIIIKQDKMMSMK